MSRARDGAFGHGPRAAAEVRNGIAFMNLNQTVLLAAICCLCAMATRAAGAERNKAPLDIKLPFVIFSAGTPPNVRSANLEPYRGDEERPPLLAPEGTKNAALGKPVVSSDKKPVTGDAAMATDGNKNGLDGQFVELGPGLQYVQIDLGAPHEIYAVVMWLYRIEQRAYHDVVVRIADDAEMAKNAKTLFNNDHDNSSGLGAGKDYEYVESYRGKLMEAGGARGRYVRIYTNGNTTDDMNHCVEVEVYALPAE